MPQGYKNYHAIFQRCMNLIFKEKIGNGVLVYIDDILVYGKTQQEHEDNFKYVLKVVNMYGLEENRDKRVECVEVMNFLGYEISENKIKPLLTGAREYWIIRNLVVRKKYKDLSSC